MIIKEFDYLSPPITLYYSKYLSHKSIFSGVLTILNYCILTISTVYYIRLVFSRTNLTSFYFKVYLEDPGIVYLNKTSFYHYLTFKDNFTFDSKAMTIIGAEMTPVQIFEMPDEYSFNHWKYSECDPSTKSVEEVNRNVKDFSGLCIDSFYNSTSKEYYKTSQKGYTSPRIQHGVGNNNSVPYGIFFKPCRNSSQIHCYDRSRIEETYKNFNTVSMNILDPYINVKNYENPVVSYINTYEIGIIQDYIRVSHSYFNPILVRTNKGLILDSYREETTYSFTQEVRGSYESNQTEIKAMLFFWMYNHIDTYERKYLQFIDIVATISGIFKLTSVIFFGINLVINEKVTLNDFGSFLNNENNHRKKKIPANRTVSELELKKNNFVHKPEVKIKKIHNKTKKVTIVGLLSFYLRRPKESLIANLINLRRKLVSEKRIIKSYIKLKEINKVILSPKTQRSPEAFYFVNMLNDNRIKTLSASSNYPGKSSSFNGLIQNSALI